MSNDDAPPEDEDVVIDADTIVVRLTPPPAIPQRRRRASKEHSQSKRRYEKRTLIPSATKSQRNHDNSTEGISYDRAQFRLVPGRTRVGPKKPGFAPKPHVVSTRARRRPGNDEIDPTPPFQVPEAAEKSQKTGGISMAEDDSDQTGNFEARVRAIDSTVSTGHDCEVKNKQGHGASAMAQLLPSRFRPDRTGLMPWHKHRYIKSLWGHDEETNLMRECLTTLDNFPNTENNSMAWAASFDRYGVPLSDLFTYGLKPHPMTTRGTGEKVLRPRFCILLTTILVHPFFQGDVSFVRYILQYIVCLRVGLHEPPVTPVPAVADSSWVLKAARGLCGPTTPSPQEKRQAICDAYLLSVHRAGPTARAENHKLGELLEKAICEARRRREFPKDTAANHRRLCLLLDVDVEILLRSLDGISSHTTYLSTEEYFTSWLAMSSELRDRVKSNLGELIRAWSLSDERNFRIRKELGQNPDRHLYDIAEDDSEPPYANSQYLTEGMRSVLRGEYLTAICPPKHDGPRPVDNYSLYDVAGMDEADQESVIETESVEDADSRCRDQRGGAAIGLQELAEEDVWESVEDADSGADDQGDGSKHEPEPSVAEDKPAHSGEYQVQRESSIASVCSIYSLQSSEADHDHDHDHDDTAWKPPQRGLWRKDRKSDLETR